MQSKNHKKRSTVAALLLLILISSCATEKGMFASKKYKHAMQANRQMEKTIKELQADTLNKNQQYQKLSHDKKMLHQQYQDLQRANADLGKKYEQYVQQSTLNADQLRTALLNEQKELRKKESLLMEREKRLVELESMLRRQDSIAQALNQKVKQALLGFQTDELTIELKEGKVYVSMTDRLLFKSGSASVEKKGKEALQKLADVLAKNSDIKVLIEGHTDNVPIKNAAYQDNWDLSVARATSIVRILCQDFHMDPTKLTASGKSEFYPVADNTTAIGKAKNRRTEIVLIPNLEELYKLVKLS